MLLREYVLTQAVLIGAQRIYPALWQLMAEVLRGVYSFPNVRRAPGKSGTLKR